MAILHAELAPIGRPSATDGMVCRTERCRVPIQDQSREVEKTLHGMPDARIVFFLVSLPSSDPADTQYQTRLAGEEVLRMPEELASQAPS